jgi:hypothetical protein
MHNMTGHLKKQGPVAMLALQGGVGLGVASNPAPANRSN